MNDIKVFDFHRMFFGDLPAFYLLEIIFRTFIMYAYTILMLRLLGKRGMGQLSTLELAIIICFGSAVGDPMMGADVPIVHGIVAITAVALMQLAFERFINSHRTAEEMMEGKPECLVTNGVIDLDILKKSNLSHADLYRSLRFQQIQHLGQVQKAFFETSGQISVLYQPKSKEASGLPILPEFEIGTYIPPVHQIKSGNYSCLNCGTTIKASSRAKLTGCKKCGCEEFIESHPSGS